MDSIAVCSNTLYMSTWKWEAVWGGCQPQTWRNDIILTTQVTPRPQNQQSRVDICIRLLVYADGQHINVLKHFVYV